MLPDLPQVAVSSAVGPEIQDRGCPSSSSDEVTTDMNNNTSKSVRSEKHKTLL